jgi:hypothetical protein
MLRNYQRWEIVKVTCLLPATTPVPKPKQPNHKTATIKPLYLWYCRNVKLTLYPQFENNIRGK